MIYFVMTAGGMIKIGSTDKLEQRLSQLAWQLGKPLTLLGLREGGREEESAIHERFEQHRIDSRAELFRPDPGLLDFIGVDPASLPETVEPRITIATRRVQLHPITLGQIRALRKRWGPASNMTPSEVIARAVAFAYQHDLTARPDENDSSQAKKRRPRNRHVY